MDTILIRQLKIQTVIGVYPVERQFKQILLLDLDLKTDAARVAETDTLAQALNYAGIATFIETFAASQSFNMIETFAHRLSEALAKSFGIEGQVITVYKPGAVLTAQTVGIRIERGII
ncbi:MAG: dihydroneopterin aldolase [Gammaproteobacteria bacterium]